MPLQVFICNGKFFLSQYNKKLAHDAIYLFTFISVEWKQWDIVMKNLYEGRNKMNETTITISTEEYTELIMCRIRLNILADYVDDNKKSYFDDDYIRFILGVRKKEVK